MPGERSLRTLRLESGSGQAEAGCLVILLGMNTIEISLTTISKFATLIWKAEREVYAFAFCISVAFETSAFFLFKNLPLQKILTEVGAYQL